MKISKLVLLALTVFTLSGTFSVAHASYCPDKNYSDGLCY